MSRQPQRQQAQMDLAEALSLNAPAQQPQAPPAPGLPPPRPPGPPGGQMPPQGALGMGGGPPSPLQATGSFRSPPVAAVLQGPQGMQGHPALTKPVGFSEGGFVVFPRGKPW